MDHPPTIQRHTRHGMTDFFGFGACHSGFWVAIRWFLLSLVKSWCWWPRHNDVRGVG